MIAERGGRAQTTAGPQQRVDRRRGGIGDREQGSACEGAGDTVPVRDLRPSRSERVCRALARAGATGEHGMGGRDRLLQQDMRAAEIPLSEDTLHQHAAQQDSATERGQSLLDRTARMEKRTRTQCIRPRRRRRSNKRSRVPSTICLERDIQWYTRNIMRLTQRLPWQLAGSGGENA